MERVKTVLFFACLFLLTTLAAHASVNWPEVDVSIGDNGVVAENSWAPVNVRIRTNDEPFDGRLCLIHRERGWPDVVHAEPMRAPAHAIRDVTFTVRFGMGFFETLDVALEQDGKRKSKDLYWKTSPRFEKDPLNVSAEVAEIRKVFAEKWPPRRSRWEPLLFGIFYVCAILFLLRSALASRQKGFLVLLFLLMFVALQFSSGAFRTSSAKDSIVEYNVIRPRIRDRIVAHSVYMGSTKPFRIDVTPNSLVWLDDKKESQRALERIEIVSSKREVVLFPKVPGVRVQLLTRQQGESVNRWQSRKESKDRTPAQASHACGG